jgi:hypothetical protein
MLCFVRRPIGSLLSTRRASIFQSRLRASLQGCCESTATSCHRRSAVARVARRPLVRRANSIHEGRLSSSCVRLTTTRLQSFERGVVVTKNGDQAWWRCPAHRCVSDNRSRRRRSTNSNCRGTTLNERVVETKSEPAHRLRRHRRASALGRLRAAVLLLLAIPLVGLAIGIAVAGFVALFITWTRGLAA